MEKEKYEEKVKVKKDKGRPKEVVLKDSNDEAKKKKTTYEFEKTRYAGIYRKYKCVDGKRVEELGYRVNLELGNVTEVDKNGNLVKKRKRSAYVVKTLTEARQLKATENSSIATMNRAVTVEEAWNDFFDYIKAREGNDVHAETTIYQYTVHRRYMEHHFGKNRKIKEINTLEFDNFFIECYKGNAYTGTPLGNHTCIKLKSSIMQLYKFMSKAPDKYGTDINAIKNATVSKNKSKREKEFQAKALSIEEINLLIRCAVEECETRDAGNLILLALCCLTGLRRGEALGLRWCDISELKPGGKIYIHNNRTAVGGKAIEKSPKTNKNRYAADLSNATYMMLKIAKNVIEEKLNVTVKPTDYIYMTAASLQRDDRTAVPNSLWRRYQEFCMRSRRKLLAEEKIEYKEYREDEDILYEKIPKHRIHDLRTSYSTCLISLEGIKEQNINVPLFEISFSLGHSLKGNVTVTHYFQDNYDRSNIRKYWDAVIDLKPMKEYIKRHNIK